MDLSVFFAGTGGSVPSARRGLPATLIRRGGDRILVDCGEGTQRQLVKSVGLADLDDIFVTHFHADHWLGLPGMLKSFDLRDRDAPLTISGPRGTRDLLQRMSFVFGRLSYELTIEELEPGRPVELDGYQVTPFAVRHRGPAFGYAIVEPPRPGRFDADRARELGVTPGPDFGRLQRGHAVGDVTPDMVMGEARAGRKVVLSGDTTPCEATGVAAHGADVLVHEATFLHEERARAAETRHSTARQAAELAADAEVGTLVLTHVSPRYAGGELRDEARAVFPRTEVPRDFDVLEVPFPEKGHAELHRWDGGRGPAATAPVAAGAPVRPA
jgi:ribonuclease Z